MWNNVCRLCRSDKDLIWVFQNSFDSAVNLNEVVFVTVGVKILKKDFVSQKICGHCHTRTADIFEFRQRSIQTDKFLKEQYAVKILPTDALLQTNNKNVPKRKSDNLSDEKSTQIKPNYQTTEKILESSKIPRNIHPSISAFSTTYPKIILPTNVLSFDVNPSVCMELDAVENYFACRKMDLKKTVQKALSSFKASERKIKQQTEMTQRESNKSMCSPTEHPGAINLNKDVASEKNSTEPKSSYPADDKLVELKSVEYMKHNCNGLEETVEKTAAKFKKKKLSVNDLPSIAVFNPLRLIETPNLQPKSKSYICSICNSVQKTAGTLKKHVEEHLRCNFCRAKFKLIERKEIHETKCLVRHTLVSEAYVQLTRIELDLQARTKYPVLNFSKVHKTTSSRICTSLPSRSETCPSTSVTRTELKGTECEPEVNLPIKSSAVLSANVSVDAPTNLVPFYYFNPNPIGIQYCYTTSAPSSGVGNESQVNLPVKSTEVSANVSVDAPAQLMPLFSFNSNLNSFQYLSSPSVGGAEVRVNESQVNSTEVSANGSLNAPAQLMPLFNFNSNLNSFQYLNTSVTGTDVRVNEPQVNLPVKSTEVSSNVSVGLPGTLVPSFNFTYNPNSVLYSNTATVDTEMKVNESPVNVPLKFTESPAFNFNSDPNSIQYSNATSAGTDVIVIESEVNVPIKSEVSTNTSTLTPFVGNSDPNSVQYFHTTTSVTGTKAKKNKYRVNFPAKSTLSAHASKSTKVSENASKSTKVSAIASKSTKVSENASKSTKVSAIASKSTKVSTNASKSTKVSANASFDVRDEPISTYNFTSNASSVRSNTTSTAGTKVRMNKPRVNLPVKSTKLTPNTAVGVSAKLLNITSNASSGQYSHTTSIASTEMRVNKSQSTLPAKSTFTFNSDSNSVQYSNATSDAGNGASGAGTEVKKNKYRHILPITSTVDASERLLNVTSTARVVQCSHTTSITSNEVNFNSDPNLVQYSNVASDTGNSADSCPNNVQYVNNKSVAGAKVRRNKCRVQYSNITSVAGTKVKTNKRRVQYSNVTSDYDNGADSCPNNVQYFNNTSVVGTKVKTNRYRAILPAKSTEVSTTASKSTEVSTNASVDSNTTADAGNGAELKVNESDVNLIAKSIEVAASASVDVVAKAIHSNANSDQTTTTYVAATDVKVKEAKVNSPVRSIERSEIVSVDMPTKPTSSFNFTSKANSTQSITPVAGTDTRVNKPIVYSPNAPPQVRVKRSVLVNKSQVNSPVASRIVRVQALSVVNKCQVNVPVSSPIEQAKDRPIDSEFSYNANSNAFSSQYVSTSLVRPDINIQKDFVLNNIDNSISDTELLKKLLPRFKDGQVLLNADVQTELASNFQIVFDITDSKTNKAELKGLVSQLHSFQVPVSVQNGNFKLSYSKTISQNKKNMHLWHDLQPVDVDSTITDHLQEEHLDSVTIEEIDLSEPIKEENEQTRSHTAINSTCVTTLTEQTQCNNTTLVTHQTVQNVEQNLNGMQQYYPEATIGSTFGAPVVVPILLNQAGNNMTNMLQHAYYVQPPMSIMAGNNTENISTSSTNGDLTNGTNQHQLYLPHTTLANSNNFHGFDNITSSFNPNQQNMNISVNYNNDINSGLHSLSALTVNPLLNTLVLSGCDTLSGTITQPSVSTFSGAGIQSNNILQNNSLSLVAATMNNCTNTLSTCMSQNPVPVSSDIFDTCNSDTLGIRIKNICDLK